MKVLVVGSGGREHALVWKLAQSKAVEHIYCAPGNAGISRLAECVDIAASDVNSLADFAAAEGVGLTVVGPEDPLTRGIVDVFEERGLRIFGPSAEAARLEGSKVFTKKFLQRHGIPTAACKVFKKAGKAKKYIRKIGAPVVVKADGLAAGKGVIVAHGVEEACDAVDLIMKEKAFGEAGSRLVVEEFLDGEEVSFIAFTDGETVLPLPSSQDHKAVGEGDTGPNTGGMGAYSPAPLMSDSMARRVMEEVMLPTVRGMAADGRPYKGMLYAGLMVSGNRIDVLEFNCRFGDPECQPLLMRMQTDLVEVLEAVIDGSLAEVDLEVDPRPAVCVVMASGGYPGSYRSGRVIKGLDRAGQEEDVVVFHAGTALDDRGRVVTAGGRVLGVTAMGEDIAAAVERAYQVVDMISWKDCYVRRDIAHRALRRLDKARRVRVGIVMGSDSDLPAMRAAADFLASVGVGHEVVIASAHRTPDRAAEYAATAAERGLEVIIAGAGMAAHLAGVLAAHTDLPVIGVPMDASALNGMDALLSTVMMPPGVPVACMGIGKSGAKNAGVFAARILARHDPDLARRLAEFRDDMARQVDEKNRLLAQDG